MMMFMFMPAFVFIAIMRSVLRLPVPLFVDRFYRDKSDALMAGAVFMAILRPVLLVYQRGPDNNRSRLALVYVMV